MPALTKKKKRKTSRHKPFTGLYDRHGQANLQVGKENPSAKELHKLLKKELLKKLKTIYLLSHFLLRSPKNYQK